MPALPSPSSAVRRELTRSVRRVHSAHNMRETILSTEAAVISVGRRAIGVVIIAALLRPAATQSVVTATESQRAETIRGRLIGACVNVDAPPLKHSGAVSPRLGGLVARPGSTAMLSDRSSSHANIGAIGWWAEISDSITRAIGPSNLPAALA